MKILVVDDNIDNLDMLVIMLKSQNYIVNTANNGQEALEKLSSDKYDLIISDILMPVMDGFQFCRECKKDPELRKLCFVFYTATYIDSKDEAFALALGAQKFIRKPQEPEVFLNIIKETIRIPELSRNEPIVIEQNEKEILKLYSERLITKLEKKNLDLENEIASHKITETKLIASEERFRNLFLNNLSVMLLIAPDTGQIIDANKSAENYYGWSHQQLTSMKIQDINTLNKDTLPELKKARLQKQIHFEFQHRLANGSIHDVEVFSSKIEMSGKEVLHSIIHDITERKRSELALRESEKKLREAQELAHLGFWCMDIQTGNVEWSDEVYKIFHLDPKKFTPHIDSILALSPWPEYNQRDKEIINRAIENHGPGSYEQKFLRPDQSIGHYYSTFQGNYDENGVLISIVGTVLDITENKKAAEAIQQLNTELEQRVIQRTAELEDANKELEAFSSSVSHDLRAPLRAIDGFISILIEDYAEKLNEEGKRVCSVISEKAKYMGQLIDDLLAFSRLNRTGLKISLIDMKASVQSVFSELTTPELRKRVDFHIADLTPINGDPALIRQVWVNLISNALKFSSKREHAVISIKQQLKDNGKVTFCISDNGAGFDMNYAHKLFGVFQRLHSSQEFEGTGVGLANVQRIIHRHGGTVWAEGGIDKGASFYFSLPIPLSNL